MAREEALRLLAEIVASPQDSSPLLDRPASLGRTVLVGGYTFAGDVLEGDPSAPDVAGVVAVLSGQGWAERGYATLSPPVAFLNIDEIEDEEGAPVLGVAPTWERAHRVAEFVKANGTEERRVLIHCFEGRNRSAAMAVAVLMLLERQPLIDAVKELWAKRPFVLQNVSFREQLVQLAEQEGLLVAQSQAPSNRWGELLASLIEEAAALNASRKEMNSLFSQCFSLKRAAQGDQSVRVAEDLEFLQELYEDQNANLESLAKLTGLDLAAMSQQPADTAHEWATKVLQGSFAQAEDEAELWRKLQGEQRAKRDTVEKVEDGTELWSKFQDEQRAKRDTATAGAAISAAVVQAAAPSALQSAAPFRADM